MIDGVKIKKLNKLTDERGFLMEILRNDDELYSEFGQIYITSCNPGIAKAWHAHEQQEDNFCVISGKAKIVLYDSRKYSKTFGKIQELEAGEDNPILIQIPRNVFHGFECLGDTPCIVLNCTTKEYNKEKPDELRLPFDTNTIPYKWTAKKGG